MLNYVKEIYLGVWPQNANLKKKWDILGIVGIVSKEVQESPAS